MKYYMFILIIYSFIGWLIEVTFVSIGKRKLINRGFMLGPVVPIYGFGGLFIIFFLSKYEKNYITLFFMSMWICAILEYITSFVMEKIFKLRWWDYSDRKFHINGRVTLDNLILFGILGVITMVFVNPHVTNIYNNFNTLYLNIFLMVTYIVFILDFITSFKLTYNIKLDIKTHYKDSTEEIKQKIKELYQNRPLYKRIVKAFPNLKKHQ